MCRCIILLSLTPHHHVIETELTRKDQDEQQKKILRIEQDTECNARNQHYAGMDSVRVGLNTFTYGTWEKPCEVAARQKASEKVLSLRPEGRFNSRTLALLALDDYVRMRTRRGLEVDHDDCARVLKDHCDAFLVDANHMLKTVVGVYKAFNHKWGDSI